VLVDGVLERRRVHIVVAVRLAELEAAVLAHARLVVEVDVHLGMAEGTASCAHTHSVRLPIQNTRVRVRNLHRRRLPGLRPR